MASLPLIARRDPSVNVEWFEPSRSPSEFYFVQPNSPYRDWLNSLRRHWLLTTVVGTIIMLCVISGLWLTTPQYQATALVMIQPRRTAVVKIDPVLSPLPTDSETVTSELSVLRSRDLLLRLVAELHLDADPEFDPNITPFWKRTARGVFESVEAWLPLFIAGSLTTSLADRRLEGESRTDAVAERVGGNLDVSVVGNRSHVIGITFISKNPELPNVVVNTLADLYIANQFEMKRRASAEVNNWVRKDLPKLKENVAAAALLVANYRAANGLIEGRDTALIRQEISELDTHLAAAHVQRMGLAAKLDNIASPNSSTLVLSSPIIQELRKQQTALATQKADFGSYLADKHLRLQSSNAQMADIERNIKNETQKIVSSLRSDYNAALENENSLRRQLDRLKQEYERVQLAEVTLKQLEAEENTERALYTNFLERSKETSRMDFEIPEAVLISHAAAPLSPFSPKKKLILSLGFLLSVLGSFIAALVREKMDRGFRSQEQLERALCVPVLGIVPEFPRKAYSGTLNVLSLVGSVMTDLYMRLKSDGSQCFLVASALPHEGKTTVGLLLARVAAINGKRVLFVDGDLRRSGLGARFGTRKGLSDVLTAQANIAEAVIAETESGIDVITCGRAANNPSGVLASEAMSGFISKARQTYDIVIVDSPAIMAGQDAAILGQLADQTLLFVRWARTPREVVNVALRRLNEGGATSLSVILSRADLRQIGRYSVTDALSYTSRIRRYYPAAG